MMLTFTLATLLGLAEALTANCSATGAQCKATSDCCNTGGGGAPGPDHCEAVNQYYSKCVTQPTCALDNKQCKGKGDTVMEPTPCCTKGFVCKDHDEYYSSCVNASAPTPPPPGPAPTCADDGAQCGGPGFKPPAGGCCHNESKCEVVNPFYSKCVDQPKCVAEDKTCGGKGDHTMEPTPCCDANDTCVLWGTDWNVCRSKGHETCSVHGEQCFGTGGSAMPLKDCCDPTDTCKVVNPYYSKCDKNTSSVATDAVVVPDSCPGLKHCPTATGAYE